MVSNDLDSLVDRKVLFEDFISTYHSSNNKKKFLEGSVEFQSFKAQLDTDKKEATRKLYSE